MQHPDNDVVAEAVGTAPIEVAVLDAEGVIIAVNGPWTDFCEVNGGDPTLTGVGVNYLDVCRKAADDPGATQVADAIRAVLAGNVPSADRVQIACHSPFEERWFDVFVSTRIDETGATVGATVMLTQVPEMLRDLAVVDHRNARDLLEACPDALLIADDHGVVESVNRRAEQLFGCSPAVLIGRSIDDLIPGFLTDQRSGHTQLSAVRADDGRVPVEVRMNSQLVRGETHQIAAVRDISERIRAERRKQLIDRAVDGASDAIVVFDETRFTFLYANRGATAMFGYQLSELTGSMSLTDLAPELRIGTFAAALSSLRATPHQHLRFVTNGLTKTGCQLTIEVQINWPAPISPNAARPVVAVVRHLSENRPD
ncbi:MAG: PAS domain S-box protein [Acidimicrobiia bacterium]|nr:PAS domain S-box protein [Acidimicrobiia bacterium]